MERSDRFLTVREAAQELRLSAMTLYRAIKANQFPAIRIAGRWVIDGATVREMAVEAKKRGGVVNAADWVVKPTAA
jgi:excisionase family DNA binding protein